MSGIYPYETLQISASTPCGPFRVAPAWRPLTIDPCPRHVFWKERLLMKHATSAALESLFDLLEQIRAKEDIREKKLGVFYRKSKSFLHFHEDPAGLFADLSIGVDFERYPVNTKQEWKVFLAAIDRASAL